MELFAGFYLSLRARMWNSKKHSDKTVLRMQLDQENRELLALYQHLDISTHQ